MPLTFFHTCEAADVGASDYSAGNGDGSLINGGTIETAAVKIGTYGLRGPTATYGGLSFSQTGWGPMFPGQSSPSTSVGSFGFWFRWNAGLPTSMGVTSWFGLKTKGTDTNDSIGLCGPADSDETNLALRISHLTNGAHHTELTGGLVTADNWFFVVAAWDIPNDLTSIKLYNASLELIDSASSSDDLSTYAPSELGLNCVLGGKPTLGSRSCDFDNFFIHDSYTAPIAANANMTAYSQWSEGGSPLILPHRSSGGMIDLSGNFRG